jgi:hypothetical protein
LQRFIRFQWGIKGAQRLGSTVTIGNEKSISTPGLRDIDWVKDQDFAKSGSCEIGENFKVFWV